ncbi:MAG: hypothetical protein ABR511_11210 [Acidimicrobiales bacterium]
MERTTSYHWSEMRALPSPLRKKLEIAVLGARRASESACRAAIDGLGVFADRRPDHLDADRAALRNDLRAKWRQLGGDRSLLVAECAYEQWHRLLLARFLAENRLLLHPQYRAPVTLADCEELAADLGEADGWSVAARFAAEILPGIFRLDDLVEATSSPVVVLHAPHLTVEPCPAPHLGRPAGIPFGAPAGASVVRDGSRRSGPTRHSPGGGRRGEGGGTRRRPASARSARATSPVRR